MWGCKVICGWRVDSFPSSPLRRWNKASCRVCGNVCQCGCVSVCGRCADTYDCVGHGTVGVLVYRVQMGWSI